MSYTNENGRLVIRCDFCPKGLSRFDLTSNKALKAYAIEKHGWEVHDRDRPKPFIRCRRCQEEDV